VANKDSKQNGSKRRNKKRRTSPRAGAAAKKGSNELAPGAGDDAKDSFAIVGIGASAGGLEALQEFFTHTPSDSGMAFVVVTHQNPDHTSLMPELLGRHTAMPVTEVGAGTVVQPNHVYVAPPGMNLAILSGVLTLMDPPGHARLHLPIDYFFRSLARDQKERAIGIVLSGTGTDGTLGLKEIKSTSGMIMVQAEQSARYASMPHSAIATKLVDYILPTDELPAQLVAYAQGLSRWVARPVQTDPTAGMRQLFVLLRNRTGHDFSCYKMTTIRRRIDRRMNVHHIDSIGNYVRYLQANPNEIDILFQEMLIGVTSFFRDPEAFESLRKSVVSQLLADKPDNYVVRVWAPGCSTGEEAYSLAILLRECMDELKTHLDVQIFATDLDHRAINIARTGVYPEGIAVDVSPTRIEQFFTRGEHTYRVKKEIREMVIFAPQNLIADPPFTKLDLLSCRNLLIYLGANLQERLVPIFHYALKPGGILFLGSAESLGESKNLFGPLDKKWKIFRRKEVAAGTYVPEFPAALRFAEVDTPASDVSAPQASPTLAAPNIARIADKLLLNRLVPASLLVRERGDIVHVHGRTGLYFEMSPGMQATNNIFNMAREGLELYLASALRQLASSDKEVLQRGIRVKTNGDWILVDVRVARLAQPEALRGLFLLSFENPRPLLPMEEVSVQASDAEPPDIVPELRRELQHAQESHQSTIEELQSANEELQSTNEELQTSKEEMQSLNEELNTVNAELAARVSQLSLANDDMENLLNAPDIATIFLDRDVNIRRYTPHAANVVSLIPSDVGRPLADLVTKLRYDTFLDDAREVMRTLVAKNVEVAAEDDSWYLLRMRPYRTTDNVIDGLVITFVDITAVRRGQLAEAIVQTVQEPLIVLDAQLRVVSLNRHFCAVFGGTEQDALGSRIYDLRSEAWNIPQLRHVLEEILPQRSVLNDFEVTHDFPGIGRKTMFLNARRLVSEVSASYILLAFRMQEVADGA
jgi:two-component system CheB/CheR fusion protein